MVTPVFPLAVQVPVPSSHWDGLLAADLFAPCGTPWIAVWDGVAVPRDVPLGGHALLLTADDGTQAYYAHGAPERAAGRVRAGQVIGAVSDSGNAAGRGCHLHLALGQIDDQGAGTIAPWEALSGATVATVDSPAQATASPQARPWLLLAAAVALLLVMDDL